MTVLLTFLILLTPFVVAALLSGSSDRGRPLRTYFEGAEEDTRTRFAQSPSWPLSGGTGERR